MTEREALKLALEALKWSKPHADAEITYNEAITAIKEALANVATNDTSQERVDKTSKGVHEPVAWVSSEELLVMRGNALGGAKDWRINVGLVKQDGDVGLYTTPPQRKPLTDEEIFSCENSVPDETVTDRDWCIYFARAIEAAHGIKGEA